MSQSGPSGLLVNVNNGREAAIRCGSTLVQVHSSNGRFDVTLVDAPPPFFAQLDYRLAHARRESVCHSTNANFRLPKPAYQCRINFRRCSQGL